MAKFEKTLNGSFDEILNRVEQGILQGSVSASFEDGSDFYGESTRCSVRVFERYSMFGGNRVSLNVTLYQNEKGEIFLSAISSGGSQATFIKINTLGEDNFLNKLKELV